MQGTKFENREELAIAAYALLREEDRAWRVELDAESDQEKYRQAKKNKRQRNRDIHCAFQEIRVPDGNNPHRSDQLEAIDLQLLQGIFTLQCRRKYGNGSSALASNIRRRCDLAL